MTKHENISTECKPILAEAGITNELEQKKIVEFFYTLGTIVYNFKYSNEKEID